MANVPSQEASIGLAEVVLRTNHEGAVPFGPCLDGRVRLHEVQTATSAAVATSVRAVDGLNRWKTVFTWAGGFQASRRRRDACFGT
jgi:hypothetical protein